jgi:hypothetical protein
MKLIILLLFLVIISGVQAISNQDFNMNFTSEDTTIIHTYEQPHHQFNGTISLPFQKNCEIELDRYCLKISLFLQAGFVCINSRITCYRVTQVKL